MGRGPGMFNVRVEQSAEDEPWEDEVLGTVGAACSCFQGS